MFIFFEKEKFGLWAEFLINNPQKIHGYLFTEKATFGFLFRVLWCNLESFIDLFPNHQIKTYFCGKFEYISQNISMKLIYFCTLFSRI